MLQYYSQFDFCERIRKDGNRVIFILYIIFPALVFVCLQGGPLASLPTEIIGRQSFVLAIMIT